MLKEIKINGLNNESEAIEVIEFGSIYSTKEYDKFKFISSNRNIDKLNYAKLKRSMKQEQLIIPICINERMQVIDCQLRLKVCEELGLPVYFYMLKGYTISQMKRANLVSKNWNKENFLHAYIEEGNENYIAFFELKTKYNVLTNDLIKIISKFKGVSFHELAYEFEEETFKVNEEVKKKAEEFLICLDQFSFFKESKKSKFVSAFLELYCHPAYKNQIMVSRLKTRMKVLEPQLSKDDYLLLLSTKIYSFGSTKDCIYYNKDTKSFH